MLDLTEPQQNLVRHLDEYPLKDLYSLIGSAAAETGDGEVQENYVLGTPDTHERGARIVADVRASICSGHERLQVLIREHRDTLELMEWISIIADAVLASTVAAGVPPLTIATALGKICNRSLSKLCPATQGT